MTERLVYPEWLEADGDALAEEIDTLESELYENDPDIQAMRDERRRLLKESPKLHAAFGDGEPQALTAEEVGRLARILDLERRMRNITDQAIFLYGRKNAFMFMRSAGII